MKRSDRVPGLIGGEYHDNSPKNLLRPDIVRQGTAWQRGARPSPLTAIDPVPKGNDVFNATTNF